MKIRIAEYLFNDHNAWAAMGLPPLPCRTRAGLCSLAGGVQDNGFVVQSEQFDYLLDLDGNIARSNVRRCVTSARCLTPAKVIVPRRALGTARRGLSVVALYTAHMSSAIVHNRRQCCTADPIVATAAELARSAAMLHTAPTSRPTIRYPARSTYPAASRLYGRETCSRARPP